VGGRCSVVGLLPHIYSLIIGTHSPSYDQLRKASNSTEPALATCQDADSFSQVADSGYNPQVMLKKGALQGFLPDEINYQSTWNSTTVFMRDPSGQCLTNSATTSTTGGASSTSRVKGITGNSKLRGG